MESLMPLLPPSVRVVVQRVHARWPRERIRAFAKFLWHRFVEDRCFESAGSLSYTTIFAIVPLTAAAFGVMSAFEVFDIWKTRLTDFLFSNFVPQSAQIVQEYILQFADSATRLTTAGALALFVSSLIMMYSIEDTFNRIWRVKAQRRHLARILVYWTFLTMGPLLAVTLVASGSYLYTLAAVDPDLRANLQLDLLGWLPRVLAFTTFTTAYAIIPNRPVALRHALAGGLLATVLFELSKYGLAAYLARAPSYNQIYGALAAVPIFLLWIWLCWVVMMLGASFAASLSAFRFQPLSLRLPEGYEIFGVFRVLGRFASAQRDGMAIDSAKLQNLEPILTDDLLQRMLADLCEAKVIERNESGDWMLIRDLDHFSMLELYEALSLRVPLGDVKLPAREDPLGRCALAALDDLRKPLLEHLDRPVSAALEQCDLPPIAHPATAEDD